MAATSHPNIVDIYDVGTVGDQEPADVFIAMELVDGTDLRQWLAEGHHPREEILRVFLEAGRGLQQAHAVGITHRDFKPSNVLLGKDGRVRVVDFGLARATAARSEDASVSAPAVARRPTQSQQETTDGAGRDSNDADATADPRLTETGAVLGTPAYMAPEQWDAEGSGPPADQFSFCVRCARPSSVDDRGGAPIASGPRAAGRFSRPSRVPRSPPSCTTSWRAACRSTPRTGIPRCRSCSTSSSNGRPKAARNGGGDGAPRVLGSWR